MSFDGLPVPVIDHTGAGDGAPDVVLQRLAPIGFGRAICGDLVAAERREWWIGNGKGSEIFDGDPPHTPRGAPAQAWLTACVLEAWWRLEQAKRTGARRQNPA